MKHRLLFSFLSILLITLTSCKDKDSYDGHYPLAYTLIAFIILTFSVLGIYTNLLRDEVNDCDQFDANAAKIEKRQKRPLLNRENPFSFTKVQLAGWTVVISSSYIYLSLCKGDCADGAISSTALILMGISAGTATASAIIDKRDIQNNVSRHQNQPSEGFFVDILSDDSGISIHRFQNFIWTLVAMVVYILKVAYVKTGCQLPELSNTILALTGISGATFLTLRAGENKPNIKNLQQINQSIAN